MADSLWSRYCTETEDAETIENETGFITFLTFTDHIFVKDCFVLPMFRRVGTASILMAEVEAIARERGKPLVLTSVQIASNTCSLSLSAQLSYGFIPFLAESGKIWLRKQVPAAEVPDKE